MTLRERTHQPFQSQSPDQLSEGNSDGSRVSCILPSEEKKRLQIWYPISLTKWRLLDEHQQLEKFIYFLKHWLLLSKLLPPGQILNCEKTLLRPCNLSKLTKCAILKSLSFVPEWISNMWVEMLLMLRISEEIMRKIRSSYWYAMPTVFRWSKTVSMSFIRLKVA